MKAEAAVFRGLADPTRRRILTLLRDEGELIAGDIAARFPRVSRPGVSRHLRVLRGCGLVHAEQRGKTQAYVLDARPIAAIRDGWMASFGDMSAMSLRALRRRVEG